MVDGAENIDACGDVESVGDRRWRWLGWMARMWRSAIDGQWVGHGLIYAHGRRDLQRRMQCFCGLQLRGINAGAEADVLHGDKPK
jgi:hypothetical protein